ncbi:type I restriction endonuclease subunit R [Calidifontibacter terrae]
MSARDGSEAQWEELVLEHLAEIGWEPGTGASVAPGSGQRQSWHDLVLTGAFLDALRRLNPQVPARYLEQTAADILAARSNDALAENHRLHRILVDGWTGTTYVDHEGQQQTPTIRLISTNEVENTWQAINQVTLRDREHERRFDVVLYCNGLPVSILELKRAGAAKATVQAAHQQLLTYVAEFPTAFASVCFVVASDGIHARYGTPFTPYHHFAAWNVDDDGRPVALGDPDADGDALTGLDVLLDGVYNPERFLQLLRNFTAFDEGDEGVAKRIAKPHQYFAVTKAVGTTIDAVRGDGRAGVVWHTQGSGKSMEMELYAAAIMRRPELHNPTVIVLTDRTELDDQLFSAFDMSTLLPEKPQRVDTRDQLRTELAQRTTGGIYFTTLQKFGLSKQERDAKQRHPLLSERRNIVVLADEAHRSHYDQLDGYARHLKDALPNATLIAFTGTPVATKDRNTRAVFGDHIDVYDLNRAVEDGATVPVVFEPRLIEVKRADGLTDDSIDEVVDEATRGLDDVERRKVEQSVAVINAIYGAPERVHTLVTDLVRHWESRRATMAPFIGGPGKAMIVCATRKICAQVYDEIVSLRPDWHDDALDKGRIKVVYSGEPSEPDPLIRKHIRRSGEQKTIKQRFKDPADDLELVIVKDMMLTGYDSPPLHTLYLDRPIKGALLMQTLARVNRTFREKPDGLLVAYAPVMENLNDALAEFTHAGDNYQRDAVGRTAQEMLDVLIDRLAELDTLTGPTNWRVVHGSDPKTGWIKATLAVANFLRDPATEGNQSENPGERPVAERFRGLAHQMARAYALCAQLSDAEKRLVDIRFYNEVRVWLAKIDAEEREARGEVVPEDVAMLLAQVVDDATVTGDVYDIFERAGMEQQSIHQLSKEALAHLQEESPHVLIDKLRAQLLSDVRRSAGNSLVAQRAFSERLTDLMNRYTNQQLTAAEVIAELIKMSKDVAAHEDRAEQFSPPLDWKELAFYDAVSENDSAVELMGDDVLAVIARELVTIMRRDTRMDWTVRDDVRAKLRASIKRLLIKHGYPPDKQPEAIRTVIEQMEALAPGFAEERRAATV